MQGDVGTQQSQAPHAAGRVGTQQSQAPQAAGRVDTTSAGRPKYYKEEQIGTFVVWGQLLKLDVQTETLASDVGLDGQSFGAQHGWSVFWCRHGY